MQACVSLFTAILHYSAWGHCHCLAMLVKAIVYVILEFVASLELYSAFLGF